MHWKIVIVAIGLCIVAAALEGILSGKGFAKWLQSLNKPRFYAPLFVWVIVAILTYVLQGTIAYRLLAYTNGPLSIATLVALIAVMAANVSYNVVLDRTRDPRWAYRGLLWFLPLLGVLQILLLVTEPVSALMHLTYVAWVVGYDLPIMRALWKENSTETLRRH